MAVTPAAFAIVPRFACVIAALGWGVSVIGVFAPAETVFALLSQLADEPIRRQPMLEYWLRMCALGFTAIGLLFAAALFPANARLRLPLGVLQLVCAAVLAGWNWRNGITADCQIWDGVFLASTGIPIAIWGFVDRK